MIPTAGDWHTTPRGTYFTAANPSTLDDAIAGGAPAVLVAVNDLETPAQVQEFERLLGLGRPVLLDSGVFNLATKHAARAGISMDAALRVPVDELDGFPELFGRYVDLARRFGDRAWGYVEIDLGGVEGKRRTRARLRALGLRPIPVYHPLNDGWEYFDELAAESDRICCGNLVHASAFVRLRILATIWHRKQAHTALWIHCLGLTPSEVLTAIPFDSADSSTWLSAARWGQQGERSALKAVGTFDRELMYRHEDSASYHKSRQLGAWLSVVAGRNHATHLGALAECGLRGELGREVSDLGRRTCSTA